MPYDHQSLQAEHGIKSLSNILSKHLTNLRQMWPKYFQLATFAYNTFNTPNIGNYSPYKLVLGRKPKSLLNQEPTPDIKVSGILKEYYELLNKRLKYLHKILLDFKSKSQAMINKYRDFFQHNNRRSGLYNFTTHESIMHSFKKSNDKICRTCSYLQNYRPPYLSINDFRWKNIVRSL